MAFNQTYETIIVEKEGTIATITLNRPEVLNALNTKIREELIYAFNEVGGNEDIKVLILTGAGRAFCSGGDIKDRFLRRVEAIERGDEGARYGSGLWAAKVILLLRSLPQVTIASINGPAIGGGLTLTLPFDLRIASDTATMSLPFVRLGLVPELGSTYLLPQIVGASKAYELVFTARKISATEAKEIGLVNEVVPASDLRSATYKLAEEIAKGASLSLQLSKIGLQRGLDHDLKSQLEWEGLTLDLTFSSADHKEAVKAFLEKRVPVFRGPRMKER